MPTNQVMGSEDGGERGLGKCWQGILQAIPTVVPRVNSKAPSSNSGVVQVQSCLSRRQAALAVPGCRGWLDNGVS